MTARIGFKIPTGAKGASHEWGSLIPTICANVWLRQSKPGHSRVKVAELYNMALSTVGGFIKRKRETAVSVQTSSAGTRLSRLSHIQIGLRSLSRNNRIVLLQSFKFAWRKKR